MNSLRYIKLLLLSLALVPNASAAPPTPPSGMLVLAAKPAPALKLNNADGKSFDLRQTRGHWTLVHFWASWCGPCRKEMPTLQAMATRLPALKVVLINTAETDDEVFSFLATVSPDLDSLLDRDGSVTERWRPRGLPSSFIVDRKGQLRYLALGGREWTSPPYFNFLAELIKQP